MAQHIFYGPSKVAIYNFFGRAKSHKNSSVAQIGNILNLVDKIKTVLCEVEKKIQILKNCRSRNRETQNLLSFLRESHKVSMRRRRN